MATMFLASTIRWNSGEIMAIQWEKHEVSFRHVKLDLSFLYSVG